MTFLIIVLGTILGNIIWVYIDKRRDYRYKWTCPVCEKFSASSNDQSVIDRVKASHTHEE